MKTSIFAVTAIASTVALAQPHKHGHAHLHEKRTQTETSYVAGPTAYAFVLDGKPISVDEVCSGVASNQLKWADGAPAGLCSSSSSTSSTTTSASSTTTTSVAAAGTSGGAFFQVPSGAPFKSGSGFPSSASAWVGWSSSSSAAASAPTGLTAAFPDGQLDCGTFPSAYGAMALNYLGFGGWSGLQSVTPSALGFINIATGISGQSCTEGMMCSYACPPGYLKSQWPASQGANHESVGGLQCSGGKLHLTNSALSTSLCIPGMGGVQATNKAGGVIAICRTDYPGTESEVIPTEIQPGQTQALANPNAATYYTWKGGATSAQYYLNPIGTSAQDGCQWGTGATPIGNFAPINLGVGYSNGKTWLSIAQNKPTTNVQYSGTVEIIGDGLSASCKYQNGQYCGAAGCNTDGCTVAVNSGTATFVVTQ